MRKSNRFRPALNDRLEDRVVPSSLLAGLTPLREAPGGGGRDDGAGSTDMSTSTGNTSASSASTFAGGGCGGGGSGSGGTSSTLSQDSRLVQQAFQTFNSSYLAAVAALRLTATSTSGPTQAGLTAFDTAIAAAITTLDASVSSDLSNLTNTGTTVTATIDGYTATLQTELDSAATGLANSTNAAVLALNQEAKTDLKSAVQQSTSAILSDSPTGTITSSMVQTYKQAVSTAYSTFNAGISNLEQTSIANGTELDATAVSSAISTLQTALTSAISGLGTAFTSSSFNPTSTVTTDLNNLSAALAAIAAPTAGNSASASVFTHAVSATLRQYESQISQAISTAIQNYNNSLL